MTILKHPGKITENIYLNDTLQFGVNGVTTSFWYWDKKTLLLIDVGTSENVESLINSLNLFLKEHELSYSNVYGVTGSHYHFDHMGGATELWKRLVKKNPDFKILVPKDMHNLIQDAEGHIKGADTTFRGFVGTMEPGPEEAFEIVKKDSDLPLDLEDGNKIRLISTPGHTPDYCSPTLFKDGEVVFCYSGEAAGNLYHSSKIISTVSSMPSNFNFDVYMKSLEKIISLKPHALGMCHFGALTGKDECSFYLQDQKKHIVDFRNAVIKFYNEKPSVRYVIERMGTKYWEDRIDPVDKANLMMNLKLALTYGMMIDLGYRESKYEKRLEYPEN
ncbi:MAG: MBL fold metallo-hydrolase [Promethearchaeota archaeon]